MNVIKLETLMEAGVHYGNLTSKWNPKMAPYIYGIRNHTHIIDLDKTIVCLKRAIHLIDELNKNKGKILFVGTDETSSQCVRFYAKKSGNFYLHKKWVGGLFTNWSHFQEFFQSMHETEQQIKSGHINNAKEIKKFKRMNLSLEGIKGMNQLPQLLFVCNTEKHMIAIQEAIKISIPVMAILDTNSNPDRISYPIPGNSDNVTSIKMICELLTQKIIQN